MRYLSVVDGIYEGDEPATLSFSLQGQIWDVAENQSVKGRGYLEVVNCSKGLQVVSRINVFI